MHRIKLTPQDVLFFRDGKPFGSAESSFAETIFPPHPPSIMGSLRVLLISSYGEYEKFKNGEIEELKSLGEFETIERGVKFVPKEGLKIKSIILSKDEIEYFPVPSDVGEIEVGGEEKIKRFQWKKRDELPFYGGKNYEYIMFNTLNEELEPIKTGYVEKSKMKNYLLGKVLDESRKDFIKRPSEFYIDEEHIKNKLEKGRKVTPEEGGVYMYKMKRIKEGVEIVVDFDVEESIKEIIKKAEERKVKFLTLGGESRVSKYEISEEEFPLNQLLTFEELKKNYDPQTDLLKLVFITPAISKNELPEKLKGLFKIKGVSIKGTVNIGGWDSSIKLPKNMYKAYLSGIVILVEPEKELDDELYKEILNTNFSDDIDEAYLKPYEGFGMVLIGIEKNIKGGN